MSEELCLSTQEIVLVVWEYSTVEESVLLSEVPQ